LSPPCPFLMSSVFEIRSSNRRGSTARILAGRSQAHDREQTWSAFRNCREVSCLAVHPDQNIGKRRPPRVRPLACEVARHPLRDTQTWQTARLRAAGRQSEG